MTAPVYGRQENKKVNTNCDTCTYFVWDDDYEEYICDASMDEDDFIRLQESNFRGCPYYKDGDEYRIARKQ